MPSSTSDLDASLGGSWGEVERGFEGSLGIAIAGFEVGRGLDDK